MSELTLHNLKPAKGATKSRKRVGRGWSSKGKYSGRGMKGQRSRSGGKSGLKKKGLRQVMLNIPKKRGFKSPHLKLENVNVSDLEKNFTNGGLVTPQILFSKGMIKTIKNGVKVLGNGEISVKIDIKGCKLSETAKTKIEKAGGSIKAA